MIIVIFNGVVYSYKLVFLVKFSVQFIVYCFCYVLVFGVFVEC